jgi:hypothetical protein
MCHVPLCFDPVNIENALVLTSIRIGIISIAFAGDMGDITDRLVSLRLATARRTLPPGCKQLFIDRPKGYFGFLTS